MQIQMESLQQIMSRNQEKRTKRQRPAGPIVPEPREAAKQTSDMLRQRESEWLDRLACDPASFAEVELEVHAELRGCADLFVAGLLAKASERPEMAEHVKRTVDQATGELRAVEKKDDR